MKEVPAGSDQVWDQERAARVAWSRLAEPTDVTAHRMLERWGPVDSWHRLQRDPTLGKSRFAPRLADLDLHREQDRAARQGIRVVIPHDPEWPEGADRLDAPPVCLWVRGAAHVKESLDYSVAIVGARASSAYGNQIASIWAHDLTRRGVSVVSGGAFGIDAAAHRGALAAGGPTIAFLAGGVDRLYPAAHTELLTEVMGHGAVVSELPPGAAPLRGRFLTRNRLLAAFSTGTVVVEAGLRSGSLSTARWADSCSRPLAAIPGEVTAETSVGTHYLVREGLAVLVTTPDELLEAIAPMGVHLVSPQKAPDSPRDRVPESLRWCWDVVGARPMSVGRVAAAGGRSISDAEEALGSLQLSGAAESRSTGWVRS